MVLLIYQKLKTMKNTSQLRVFITDNSVVTLNLYVKYFKDMGVTDIIPFRDMHDCINSLCFNPDVIFIEHTKDLLDNLAPLKEIKKTNPDTYLVIISGQENVGANHELLNDGPFDYIVKYGYEQMKIKNIIKRIELEKKNKDSWSEIHKMFRTLKQNPCIVFV